jgi:hypothetical protein
MSAGLARARRLDLRRLAIRQGATLAFGRLPAASLLGSGGGLGALALAGGFGLLETQPF